MIPILEMISPCEIESWLVAQLFLLQPPVPFSAWTG
jgi:hypothetical protein